MFKALFFPALAAMNRMSYAVKFVFIGLLLLLPFAYVTHIMAKGSDKQIDFNQKESFGVDYIAPASRMLARLQSCRTYSAAVLAGEAAVQDDLLRAKREADGLIPLIDAQDERHREDFKTEDGRAPCSERWNEIKTKWASIRGRDFKTQEESFGAYTDLCARVTDWILNYAANYSNLILDPDLDSYWLMDAFVGKFPQITEDMSQACALGIAMTSHRKPEVGVLSPSASSLSDDTLSLHALYVDATNTLKALEDVNLKTAYDYNNAKSKSLQSTIDPLARTSMTLSRDFCETVKMRIIKPETPLATSRELVDLAKKALDATHALVESVGPELKSLIDARVGSYRHDKSMAMIAAETATFLHVYLFIAFYLAIHASVAQISKFTKRMIEGTQEHFKLDSRDELGHVAESFNQINKTLVETRALKTEVESRTAELQESEQRFRTFASRAPVGIFMTDPQGDFLYVNERWCKMTSLTPEEALGKGWVHALHVDDREKIVQEWYQAARAGQELSSEYRYGSPGQPVTWLSADSVALKDRSGTITGFLGSVTDITERKRLDQMKNDFISTVSHELRTPLTSIRGALGLIGSGVVGALPAKAKPMVEIATKNCDRLVTLVSDILDIEKIVSGQMVFKIRTISMKNLITQVMEANWGYAHALGVTLKCECALGEVMVRADSDRLTQVLTNLLSNACKYSPRGGVITVGLKKHDTKLRVSVQDRGPGIPEEFRSRIFNKFAQADASDGSQKKGTGLGLAISKGLMERMGGTIGFESTVGVGTTFFIDLKEELPAALGPASFAGNRPRILICEDERDIAQILQAMMEREGFESDVATTLKEAKELVGHTPYAGMTLDLCLPDGNGLQLLQELRQNPATAGLPVIVISANLDQNRQELKGHAFGLVDWLEKPIPEARLREALRSCGLSDPEKRPRVLHVEDDPDICRVVADVLKDVAEVVQAGTVLSAWDRLKEEDFDLMIIDLGMPDGSGLELLPALRRSTHAPIPTLVFSAHEISPRTANYVSAALLKSETSNDELVARVRSLLGRSAPAPDGSKLSEVAP